MVKSVMTAPATPHHLSERDLSDDRETFSEIIERYVSILQNILQPRMEEIV